eukprot:jgi/Bigna1/71504/fgenesh1_pg.16_\
MEGALEAVSLLKGVDTVDAKHLTRERFLESVRDGQPLLIRGAASHWKAISKWTPEYLRNAHGRKIVSAAPLLRSRGGRNAWVEPTRLWPRPGAPAASSTKIRGGGGRAKDEEKNDDASRENDELPSLVRSDNPILPGVVRLIQGCRGRRQQQEEEGGQLRKKKLVVDCSTRPPPHQREGGGDDDGKEEEKEKEEEEEEEEDTQFTFYIDGGRNLEEEVEEEEEEEGKKEKGQREAVQESCGGGDEKAEDREKPTNTEGGERIEQGCTDDKGNNPYKRRSLAFLKHDLGFMRSYLLVISVVLFLLLRFGGNAVTSMHFDSFENLYSVVRGVKKFALVAPKHSAKMVKMPLCKGVADVEISQEEGAAKKRNPGIKRLVVVFIEMGHGSSGPLVAIHPDISPVSLQFCL